MNPSTLAAAYGLLLRDPELDLDEFATRMGCSAETIRSIFDRLTDLSLLNRRYNENGEIVAVSPIVAMQKMLEQERDILADRIQFLTQSCDAFTAILDNYSACTEQVQLGELLTDLPSVRRRLEELASRTRSEVVSFSPPASNPAATRAASRPLVMDTLRRGVRMRTIYPDCLLLEEAGLKYAQELSETGAGVRTVPRLPMRFIIVDREVAVVPREPDDADGAIVVHHHALVLALLELFECYWQKGRPLPGYEDPDTSCSPAESSMLRLLASGAKDDAVARQLGMSVRTVRRTVADLSERAGTASRFALGVHTAQHGWI